MLTKISNNVTENFLEIDLNLALKNSREAQKIWAETDIRERIKRLMPIRDYLMDNRDLISETISNDTGKNIVDAVTTEVIPSILGISYYMKKSKKFLKNERLFPGSIFFMNKVSKIKRIPFGVVGIFSPWNYPFAIPFSEVIMALLAGNGVILKSAHETPNVSNILKKAIESADLPKGLFYNIDHEPAPSSKFLLENGIDKLFFTGSPVVGKILMKQAAENLIPVCLELGGNDPMVVLKDADLERAASGAVWGGFQNSGQTCAGVERIYVDMDVYDDFLKILQEKTLKLRIDSKRGPESETGMMTTKRQVDTINFQIQDALNKGAKILCEPNNPEPDNKMIIPPKIIVNVNHEMEIMKEETFGPVICVLPFNSENEAIEFANNTDYGLTASVWSKNIFRASKIAEKIRSGAVTINDHLVSHGLAETPWGGFKTSSIGRSHGKIGFDEMTQPQVIVNDLNIFIKKNVFWYPYSTKLYKGLKGMSDILYSKGLINKLKGAYRASLIIPRMFKS